MMTVFSENFLKDPDGEVKCRTISRGSLHQLIYQKGGQATDIPSIKRILESALEYLKAGKKVTLCEYPGEGWVPKKLSKEDIENFMADYALLFSFPLQKQTKLSKFAHAILNIRLDKKV